MMRWWEHAPESNLKALETILRQALEGADGPVRLFFRADDIGVPGRKFQRLLEIFRQRDMPLALAVVPVWLTDRRWQAIRDAVPDAARLWCWHQHGWRHANHETDGKKQEFGPAREAAAVAKDLLRGRDRLVERMGADFFPAFTPPWNRCSRDCLAMLAENGYKAISRSRGARPEAPSDLPDICIDVDLHTRKEDDAEKAWAGIRTEFAQGIRSGRCGVMIHHQRMTDSAFGFLDDLLMVLKRMHYLDCVSIVDMI